jgi:hypothetical protein
MKTGNNFYTIQIRVNGYYILQMHIISIINWGSIVVSLQLHTARTEEVSSYLYDYYTLVQLKNVCFTYDYYYNYGGFLLLLTTIKDRDAREYEGKNKKDSTYNLTRHRNDHEDCGGGREGEIERRIHAIS